jgi:hypothetical protein
MQLLTPIPTELIRPQQLLLTYINLVNYYLFQEMENLWGNQKSLAHYENGETLMELSSLAAPWHSLLKLDRINMILH